MRSSKSTPAPRLSSTGLPRIVAVAKARAASAAKSRLARLEQLLLDVVPEQGDEHELEYHFRDQLRWA